MAPSGPNLRILLFTDADVFAGTERHIMDLARGLRAEQVDVAVACPNPSILGEHLHREQIHHVIIQKRGLYDRAAIRILRELLISGQVDIIHAHNGRTMLSAALAVRAAGRGHCVATQHFITPNHANHRGLKRLVHGAIHHWVNQRVHAHVAISEAVRQAAIGREEIDAARIHLVHNGIADPLKSELRLPEDIRRELMISCGTPLIVCAARLEAEKGIGDLIRAMAVLRSSMPSAVCVIAGDGAERGALDAQIRGLGLGDRVRLIGFRPDVLSIVNAADVFVLPSGAEPFGLAIVEAMALGKPVVAIRAGGPMEIVTENETGLLVPPANPEAIEKAMLRLLLDTNEREAMGQRARERFESHFTAARMAREMLAMYRSIV